MSKEYKYEMLTQDNIPEGGFNEEEYYQECIELYKEYGKTYEIPTEKLGKQYPPLFALRFYLEKYRK